MDPNINPFNPGAGTPPPELVGRDPVLQQADVALERMRRGRTERSLLLSVLRGILRDVDDAKRAIAAVKRGLRVLRSFLGTVKLAAGDVEVTLGVDPEQGLADSGNLESDVKDLLTALGEAARAAGRPVALL